jgi:hypothetical protein
MSGLPRASGLWRSVVLWPLGAAVAYYLCLRFLAPQGFFYCERTAETLPWIAGEDLNAWGAVGVGLIVVATLGVGRKAFGSAASGWGRAVPIVFGLALAAFLVTLAFLVTWLDHSCGE